MKKICIGRGAGTRLHAFLRTYFGIAPPQLLSGREVIRRPERFPAGAALSALLERAALATRSFFYALVLLLVAACGSGTDLSGLISDSGEDDTAGTLSTNYGLSARAGADSVDLSWNEDSEAASYDLYRYTDSGCAFIPENPDECASSQYWSTTSTSITDNSLSSNTTYYYRMRAVNSGSTGELSPEISALTLPGVPSGFSASSSSGRVSLSWDEMATVSSYAVFRYTNQGCETVLSNISACDDDESWSVTDTSLVDNRVSGGTLYYYQIAAINSTGTGPLSGQISITTVPSSPTGFSASGAYDDGISFSWQPSNGAAQYELYRSTEASCSSIPENYTQCEGAARFITTDTSYMDSTVQDGLLYYYSLRAVNESGGSSMTLEKAVMKDLELSTPEITLIEAVGRDISLSWEPVTDALSYEVFIYAPSGCSGIPESLELCSMADTTTVDTNSVTFTDLSAGIVHYLSLRAVTGSVYSELSAEVSAITSPATPEFFSATTIDSTQVELAWEAVEGADGYSLWSHQDSDCELLVPTDIQTLCGGEILLSLDPVLSFTHANLDPGSFYYYYLIAQNGSGDSPLSVELTALTAPAAPAELASESNESAIELSWEDNLTNVNSFILFRYTDSGCELLLSSGCADQNIWELGADVFQMVDDDALQSGQIYYYRLAATNSGGTSIGAELAAATRLAAPQTPKLMIGEGQLSLQWDESVGATAYLIYRYSGACADPRDSAAAEDCADYQIVELAGDLLTYTDTDVVPGTIYSYQMAAAITGADDSELSVAVSASPLLVSPTPVLTPIAGGMRIEFDSIIGADSYIFHRYQESGCLLSETDGGSQCPQHYEVFSLTADQVAAGEGGASNSHDDLGLTGGETYYYRLSSASTGVDNSSLSAEQGAAALLATPVISAGSGDFGSAHIEWGEVLGASSYIAYAYVADGSDCYPQQAEAFVACSAGYQEAEISAADQSEEGTYGYTFTDLDGGLDYEFKLLAQRTDFADSELSAPFSLRVDLAAPESVKATASAGEINVSWQAVANAAYHRVYRSSVADCLGGVNDSGNCADYAELIPATDLDTGVNDSPLSAGTTYYYRVRAFESDSAAGSYSEEVNATPTLTIPESLVAIKGPGQVQLEWQPVLGAETHNIYRYTVAGCDSLLTDLASCDGVVEVGDSSSVYTSVGLVGGTTYYYRVAAARSDQADSGLSAEVSAVPDIGVATLSVSALEHDLSVSWNEVAGISNYHLHRSSEAGCLESGAFASCDPQQYQLFESLDTLEMLDPDLTPGVIYYYAVQSVDASDNNGSLSEVASGLPLEVPTWNEPIGGDLNVTVELDFATAGVESFALYRSTDDECESALENWSQCDDAQIFSDIVASPYVDTHELEAGATYYYRLQARNYSGSADSPLGYSVITIPAAPTSLALSFNEAGINVDWDYEQQGVESFTLYRYGNADCAGIPEDHESCDSAASWPRAFPPLVDEAADLEAGTVYYYRLQAHNASGSAISAESSLITGSAAPELESITPGYDELNLSWGAVLGAESYTLYRYTNSTCSDVDLIAGNTGCTSSKFTDATSPFNDTGLSTSTYYYYKLSSANAAGTSSLSELITGLTKPDAPTGLSADGGDRVISLSFTSEQDYLISFVFSRDPSSPECHLDLGNAVCPEMLQLDSDLSTEYTDTFQLNDGQTYYYRAYAVNDSGRSLGSVVASAVTVPSTPTSFAGYALSINEMNLSWDRQLGAEHYLIYRYTDSECTVEQLLEDISACGEGSEILTIADSDTGAFPSAVDSGLSADSYYYYRILAQNSSGNSALSDMLNLLTSPNIPDNFQVFGGDEEVRLSWNAVASVGSYNIYRSTESNCASYSDDPAACADGRLIQVVPESDALLSFYVDSDEVNNSQQYHYRLQAVNPSGISEFTEELVALTYPQAPAEVNLSSTTTAIMLTWSAEDFVERYVLYRYGNSNCEDLVGDPDACDLEVSYNVATNNLATTYSQTDTQQLNHGTVYYYQLMSVNASGYTLSNQWIATTAPQAPYDLSGSAILSSAGGIDLSWESDGTGVVNFRLYRYQPAGCLQNDLSDDCDHLQIINDIGANSYSDSSELSPLAAGERYSYRVVAVGSTSSSDPSSELTVRTYSAPPAIYSVVGGQNQITIDYNTTVTGANSYSIYRYYPSGCLSDTGDSTTCSHNYNYRNSETQSPKIDDGLTDGTTYYYRIASISEAGTGLYSEEASGITLPAAPTDILLAGGDTQITVYWDDEQLGADSFILHRYQTRGCLDSTQDYSTCSSYREVILDSANVEYTIAGEFIDTGLLAGFQYYYRMQAVNASGNGELSAEYSTYTVPAAPDIDELVPGQGEVAIEFSKDLISAASYTLYRYTNSGCEHVPGSRYASCTDGKRWLDPDPDNGQVAKVTDSGLEQGTTYYYVVTATNESGEGPISAEYAATTAPQQPEIYEVLGGSNQMTVNFSDDTPAATSYQIYRYLESGCITDTSGIHTCDDLATFTVTESPYIDYGLDAGTRYYYAMTAINAAGSSTLSSQENNYTIPDTPSSLIVTGADSAVEISFGASPGAEGYNLYRYASTNCVVRLENWQDCDTATLIPVESNSVVDAGDDGNGLGDGETWYYRVSATNEAGESSLSGQASTITYPPVAVDIEFSGDSSQIVLEWEDNQDGVSAYVVYQYSPSGCPNTLAEEAAIFGNCTSDADRSGDSPMTFGNLFAGTTYYFMIKSVNSSGYKFTDELSATTVPGTPPQPAVSGGDGQIAIDLDLANIQGYTHLQLHRYEVSDCISNERNSACSSLVSLTKADDDTNDQLDADDFPYTDTGLEAGRTYYYRVQAHNDLGSSLYSDEASALTYPAEPTAVDLEPGHEQVELSWLNSSGTDSVTVYRYSNSGCAFIPSQPTSCANGVGYTNQIGTSLLDDDLDPGVTYYYRLQANNASGSKLSTTEYSALTYPGSPTIDRLDGGANLIEVSFSDDVSSADSYTIHRYTNSGCLLEDSEGDIDASSCSGYYQYPNTVGTVLTTSPFVDTGLSAGTTYYYRILATNASGSSYLSENEQSTITLPAAPEVANITLTPGFQEITIDWNNDIIGIETTYLHRYTAAGCGVANVNDIFDCDGYKLWEVGDGVASLPVTDTSLDDNRTYYYIVEVQNDSGSAYSGEVSALTYPAAPTISDITGGDERITLTWEAGAPTVLSYTVYQYEDPTCSDFSSSSTCASSTNYTDPVNDDTHVAIALDHGIIYYFRVAAHNASGTTISDEASTLTLPEAPVIDDISGAHPTPEIDLTFSHSGDGLISYVLVRYQQEDCMDDGDYNNCPDPYVYENNFAPAITDTTFTDTNDLENGQRYYYRLGAQNSSGAAYSDAAEAVTIPSVVTPQVTSDDDSISISWTITEPEVASVYLYRSTQQLCGNLPPDGVSGLCSNFVSWDENSGTNTPPVVDRPTDDSTTTYYYVLHVENASGYQLSQDVQGVLLPTAPTFSRITGDNRQISLLWSGSGTSYTLYRYTNAGCHPINDEGCDNQDELNLLSTTHLAENLDAGTRYYFRVSSTNSEGTSALSDEGNAITIAPAPTNLAATAYGGYIVLSWDISTGAEHGYKLYRSTEQYCLLDSYDPDCAQLVNSNTELTSSADDSYTDNSLTAGTTYYYKIAADNESGESELSANQASGIPYFGAPEDLDAVSTDNGVELTWIAVSGADSYELYRYQTDNCLTEDRNSLNTCEDTITTFKIDDASTSYLDEESAGGITYYYRVAAYNEAIGLDPGDLSNQASVTADLLEPTSFFVTPGYGEVVLNWQGSIGSDYYTVYRYTSSNCIVDVATITDCSSYDPIRVESDGTDTTVTYTDANLNGLQYYYYRVGAASDSNNVPPSELTEQRTAYPDLPAPQVQVQNDIQQITLSWSAVTNATRYIVYRYTNAAGCTSPYESPTNCFSLVETDTTATQQIDIFGEGGDLYYFNVQAIGADELGDDSYGELSAQIEGQSLLDIPVNLAITKGSISISLGWTGVAGADSYEVHRYTNSDCDLLGADPASTCTNYASSSADGTSIAFTGTTGVLDTGLDPNLTYYYQVQAETSGALDGALSAVASARPHLEDVANFSAQAGPMVAILSWDPVDSANEYAVFRYESPGCIPDDTFTLTVGDCGSYTQLPKVSVNEYNDSNTSGNELEVGKSYYYRIQAYTSTENQSSYSAERGVTIFTDIGLSSYIGGDKEVNLTYSRIIPDGESVTLYRYTVPGCEDRLLDSLATACGAPGSNDTAEWPDPNPIDTYTEKEILDVDLDEGKRYYYKIYSTATSSFSSEYSAMTLPPHPDPNGEFTIDASSSTGTTITVQFEKPPGEENSYQILRYTNASCSLTSEHLNRMDYKDLSELPDDCLSADLTLYGPENIADDATTIKYTDSGLNQGTTYYYQFRTINYSANSGVADSLLGASVVSDAISFTTVPSDPAGDALTFVTSGTKTDSLELAFSAVAGAERYTIYRYTGTCSDPESDSSFTACTDYARLIYDPDTASDITTSDNGATYSLIDEGLASGTKHRYHLRAENDAGNSGITPAIDRFTSPETPVISSTVGGDENISVNWAEVSGGPNYEVYATTDAGCLTTAINSSDPATEISACTNSIYYEVFSAGTILRYHGENTDPNKPLQSGSTYYVSIRSANDSGFSEFTTVESDITTPPYPNDIALTFGYQSIEVNWQWPTGSADNTIYRYTNLACDPETSFDAATCGNGADSNITSFTFTGESTATFDITDTNLLDNTTYYYTIRTSNTSGYRYTQTPPSTTTSAGIPTGLQAVAGDKEITLTWDAAPGATNYLLCFTFTADGGTATKNGDCSSEFTLDTGTDSPTPGYTHTNLDQGLAYHYWLSSETTADSVSGSTEFSETTSVTVQSPYNSGAADAIATTLPPQPAAPTLTVEGTSIHITFSEVAGADKYQIYRTTVEGCLADANLSTVTADGSTYCGSGYSVSEISQSTIDTLGPSALSFTHDNLGNSTLYYYQITAENTATSIYGTNESRLSEAASALTVPPAPVLTATPESTTEIKVTWPNLTWNSAATGGDWYTFYISETPNCDLIANSSDPCAQQKQTMLAPESTSATVEHTFTGLAIATQYYAYAYASTSYNGKALPSELSSEVSTYTMANPTTISSHTISRNSSGNYPVTFTWTADSSVDTYQLYLSNCQNSSGSSCIYDAPININNNASNGSNITHTVTLDSSSYYYAYLNVINNGVTNPEFSDYYGFVTGPTTVSGLTLTYDYNKSSYNSFDLTLSHSNGSSFKVPDNDVWTFQYYSKEAGSTAAAAGSKVLKLSSTLTPSTNFPYPITADIPVSQTDYLLSEFYFEIVAYTSINGTASTTTNPDLDLTITPAKSSDFSNRIIAKHPSINITSADNGSSSSSASRTIVFEFGFDITGSYRMPDTHGLNTVEIYYYKDGFNFNCLDDVTHESNITDNDANSCNFTAAENFVDDGGSNSYWQDTASGLTNNAYTSSSLYDSLSNDLSTQKYDVIASVVSYSAHSNPFTLDLNQQYFSGAGPETLTVYKASSASATAMSAPTLVPIPTFSSRSFSYQPDTSLWALDLTWLPEPSASSYYLHAYTDSSCPYLTTTPEFCASYQLQSTSPEFSFEFPADQAGSYHYYRIQALDANANSSALGEQIAAYLPQALNDSGLTACVESATITGAQDCAYGRDSNFSADLKAGVGSAGFDFAANSQCLYDHVTGLSWFFSTQAAALQPSLNAEANSSAYPALSTATTNLQALASGLCGGSDWSLPSLHELLSIADYNQTGLKVDTDTLTDFNQSLTSYWSSSNHVLDFATGDLSLETNTSAAHNTMLVRGQRRWGADFSAQRFSLELEATSGLYLVYDNHSQLYYSPCLAGQSYDPIAHACLGAPIELDYIDTLNSYDLNSSWRHPNIKELIAILDPSNNLQPNPQFFPAYPADTQLFTLTPSDQGTDYLLGRHLDLSTQSTQPTLFQLLTTHPIHDATLGDNTDL